MVSLFLPLLCMCVCVVRVCVRAAKKTKVPECGAPNDIGDGAVTLITIEPPLDIYGRGTYVSSICAPMASMKSLRARIYAWAKKKGITVVIAGRISYAHNAAQEWRESAPGAKEQEAAAREALADYDELSESDRRAAEVFGAGVEAPARVWCYQTHDKEQLAALIGGGFGVCIISLSFCSTFLSCSRSSKLIDIDLRYSSPQPIVTKARKAAREGRGARGARDRRL